MIKTLEQLLDGIRKKGWKPYGQEVKDIKAYHSIHFIVRWIVEFTLEWYAAAHVSLKELLTDSNSWLWQFVCENGYNQYKKNYFNRFSKYGIKWEYRDTSDFEYYLLESALCDEDKLEEFLLDNIKIDETKNI